MPPAVLHPAPRSHPSACSPAASRLLRPYFAAPRLCLPSAVLPCGYTALPHTLKLPLTRTCRGRPRFRTASAMLMAPRAQSSTSPAHRGSVSTLYLSCTSANMIFARCIDVEDLRSLHHARSTRL